MSIHRTAAAALLFFAGLGAIAAPAPPDDASLAGLVKAANQAEIDAAKMAVTKAVSEDVKDFAQMMIDEHTQAEADVDAVLRQIAVTPKESDASKELRQEALRQTGNLSRLTGAEFDRAYMEQQVRAHRKVLYALDQAVPERPGRPAALQDLIARTRDAVAGHLRHAERLSAQSGRR